MLIVNHIQLLHKETTCNEISHSASSGHYKEVITEGQGEPFLENWRVVLTTSFDCCLDWFYYRKNYPNICHHDTNQGVYSRRNLQTSMTHTIKFECPNWRLESWTKPENKKQENKIGNKKQENIIGEHNWRFLSPITYPIMSLIKSLITRGFLEALQIMILGCYLAILWCISLLFLLIWG